MLGYNMLKASLPDHQTINMVLRKHSYFVRSNMHSLHAHHLVKHVVLSSWNVNINFSHINISWNALYWEICTFCEVWILKIMKRSTGKSVTRETFCGVRLYI